MPNSSFPSRAAVSNSPPEKSALSDEQLSELLRPGKDFENALGASIKTLPAGTTNLLIVRLKDYATTPRALLTYFAQEKMPGVYVSVNKPYMDIVKTLPNKETSIPQTQFVDAITALTGRGVEDNQVVTFIDSPLALVELNLAISDRMKGLVSNQKFLILDSVSTLLVYNTPQSVEKFCHTVIAKNRAENVLGLFLMIESEDHRGVVETLAQFVDNVITVKPQ